MSYIKKTISTILFFLFLSSNIYAQSTINVAHLIDNSTDMSPKDMQSALSLWTRELGDSTNIHFESHFYSSIDTLRQDMLDGRVDFMILKSLDTIKKFNLDNLIEGYSPVRKNNSIHNTLIIAVRKNSNIKSIKDFKNKKLGLYHNSEIEEIYLDTLLLKDKLPMHTKYFSKITRYKKHSSALLDLFFNKIDVAIITKGSFELSTEMNPQVGRAIKVLHEKSLQLEMVGFFSKHIDKVTLERYYKGIKKVSQNKRAKQILTLFKADELQRTDKKKLQTLQNFYKEYLTLKKQIDD